MAKITLGLLAEMGACGMQRREFEKLFGNEVDVTPEKCAEHFGDFDWEWAYISLLSYPMRMEYRERIRDAVREREAGYRKVHDEGEPCGEKCMEISCEYSRAEARLFGELYVKQGGEAGIART